MSIKTRIVCDFQYVPGCVCYTDSMTEDEVIESCGWEKRPGGKHICDLCLEHEKKVKDET